jgi:hypothetical protein
MPLGSLGWCPPIVVALAFGIGCFKQVNYTTLFPKSHSKIYFVESPRSGTEHASRITSGPQFWPFSQDVEQARIRGWE